MVRWPIYILSLEGDWPRRAPLVAWLTEHDIPSEIVFGIDGRRGLPKDYRSSIDRQETLRLLGRPMSDGEYACALSHREIHKRIAHGDADGGIILEDAAIPLPLFERFVSAADYRLAPMILLDYGYGRARRFATRRVSTGILRPAAIQSTMACAYSLDKATARKLIAANTPVRLPADWPAPLRRLDAWLLDPRVVTHEPPGSTRISHLDDARAEAESVRTAPRRHSVFDMGFGGWIRRKVSVRVGRQKGQR